LTKWRKLFQREIDPDATETEHVGTESNPRWCRFCNRTAPDVTFDSESHIVPRALGNDSLISWEECESQHPVLRTQVFDRLALGTAMPAGNKQNEELKRSRGRHSEPCYRVGARRELLDFLDDPRRSSCGTLRPFIGRSSPDTSGRRARNRLAPCIRTHSLRDNQQSCARDPEPLGGVQVPLAVFPPPRLHSYVSRPRS
jgi:hypothetical protein